MSRCRLSGVNGTTAKGVPAAAQITECSKSAASRNVRIFERCPAGGTPPIAKPDRLRTKAAAARSTFSPINKASFASSTRCAPLAMTRMAASLACPRKTRDFAIWATSQSPGRRPARCVLWRASLSRRRGPPRRRTPIGLVRFPCLTQSLRQADLRLRELEHQRARRDCMLQISGLTHPSDGAKVNDNLRTYRD